MFNRAGSGLRNVAKVFDPTTITPAFLVRSWKNSLSSLLVQLIDGSFEFLAIKPSALIAAMINTFITFATCLPFRIPIYIGRRRVLLVLSILLVLLFQWYHRASSKYHVSCIKYQGQNESEIPSR